MVFLHLQDLHAVKLPLLLLGFLVRFVLVDQFLDFVEHFGFLTVRMHLVSDLHQHLPHSFGLQIALKLLRLLVLSVLVAEHVLNRPRQVLQVARVHLYGVAAVLHRLRLLLLIQNVVSGYRFRVPVKHFAKALVLLEELGINVQIKISQLLLGIQQLFANLPAFKLPGT